MFCPMLFFNQAYLSEPLIRVFGAHRHYAQVDIPKDNKLILGFCAQFPQASLGSVNVLYRFDPVKCAHAVFS